MMTFVNMNSSALLILPTHRVVQGLTSFSEDDFRNSARAYFDVDEVDRLDRSCREQPPFCASRDDAARRSSPLPLIERFCCIIPIPTNRRCSRAYPFASRRSM